VTDDALDDDTYGASDDALDADDAADVAAASKDFTPPSVEAAALLTELRRLTARWRHAPSPKVLALRHWLAAHCCPAAAPALIGAPAKPSAADRRWTDTRVIVFTEYGDTKRYLRDQLREAIAGTDRAPERIVELHGGMSDDARAEIQDAFNDPKSPARILLATDAAGEGLNLQRAARHMLHWDIPWNPARMEQRNGRLDRHGQERDVFIFHFDSTDDASMRFLGKVLRKRSQTREDRVITDEIFSDAILAHFAEDEDAAVSDERLDRVIGHAHATNADVADDLPAGAPLPGADDLASRTTVRAASAWCTPCRPCGRNWSITLCAPAGRLDRCSPSSLTQHTTYSLATAGPSTSLSPTRACCTSATRSTTASCRPSPATDSPAGRARRRAGRSVAATFPAMRMPLSCSRSRSSR